MSVFKVQVRVAGFHTPMVVQAPPVELLLMVLVSVVIVGVTVVSTINVSEAVPTFPALSATLTAIVCVAFVRPVTEQLTAAGTITTDNTTLSVYYSLSGSVSSASSNIPLTVSKISRKPQHLVNGKLKRCGWSE